MKRTLFIVMSALEAAAGLALIVAPSTLVLLLLGSSLDTPAGTTIGRIAGAGLLALGVACWVARDDERSRSAAGLIGAMLFYNIAAATVLTYAGIGEGFSGVGLWPAVLAHAALAVWCAGSLRSRDVSGRKGPE